MLKNRYSYFIYQLQSRFIGEECQTLLWLLAMAMEYATVCSYTFLCCHVQEL